MGDRDTVKGAVNGVSNTVFAGWFRFIALIQREKMLSARQPNVIMQLRLIKSDYLPSLCGSYIADSLAEICDETDVQPWTCIPQNVASYREVETAT